MTQEEYKKLTQKIPDEFKLKYTENGKEFTGYHAQYAIDLLNEVVGVGNWETEIDIRKEELVGGAWAVAGILTIKIGEVVVNGCGGAYARDIANAYKGFKTSAFKNACRYLGIGKELYVQGFEDDIGKLEENKAPVEADNDLAKKIESAESDKQLESLKDSIQAVEGKAVKDVLLKKYNDKMIKLKENV